MPVSKSARREAYQTEAAPHLDSLYRFALQLSGDPMLADDLVQETMLKAYRHWDRYEEGTNARAWLFTILRNTYISHYRRKRNRVNKLDLDEIEDHTVFEDVRNVDPAGRFFDGLVDDEVIGAIASLPPEYREALILSDAEGFRYADVAEIVGAPLGTVKSRIHRARKALQATLYDYAVEMGYVRAPAGEKVSGAEHGSTANPLTCPAPAMAATGG